MSAAIEEVTAIDRQVTLVIPESEVRGPVTDRLRQLSKTVTLKGFRKGKVPIKVVESKFKQGVQQEILHEKVNEAASALIHDNDISPVSQLALKDYKVNNDKDHEFTLSFEVMPKVDVASMAGKSVVCSKTTVTDEDLENEIKDLLKRNHKWEEVDRPAEEGHRVTAKLTLRNERETILKVEPAAQFIATNKSESDDEIAEGCIGKVPADEFRITFKPEEDETDEDHALRYCDVVVERVERPLKDELIDYVFFRYAVMDRDQDKLRAAIRAELEQEATRTDRNYLRLQVVKHICDTNDIDPPKALIREAMLSHLRAQGLSDEMAAEYLASNLYSFSTVAMMRNAHDTVVQGIAMQAAASAHDVKPTPELLDKYLRLEAECFPDPEQAHEAMQANASQHMDEAVATRTTELMIADADCKNEPMNLAQVREASKALLISLMPKKEDSNKFESGDDDDAEANRSEQQR